MTRQRSLLAGVAALFGCACVTMHAQSAPPLFSTGTNLVVLHVTVKDRRGAYLTALSKDAFTVFESGRPQVINFFSDEDAPVTVGLVVDNSGSMRPNRDGVVAAAAAFAESSNPQDELFALAFDEDVRAALPATAPFTSDVHTLRDALTRTLSTRGRTALFDAIVDGLRYLDHGRHERKVLIVVSDGGDNASHATLAEVIAKAQQSNALIYTVALVDPIERETNPTLLKQVAEASGGEAFAPRDIRDVGDVLQHVARDIRHTYTIGYISDDQTPNGTFRKVRLSVRPPDGRRVVLRTRAGYVGRTSGGGGR